MIIRSTRIVAENGIIDGVIVVEDRKIVEIKEYKEGMHVDVDYQDDYIIPGIHDTHNHGTMGYSLIGDATEEEIKGYLKGLASQGVTCIFPTCHIDTIATISKMATEDQDGAKILGIHSEGPWLNRVGEKGIHTGWPEVSVDVAKKMIKDGNGLLRLVDLAPEIPGIDEVMSVFKDAGITIGFAHSDCNYKEANEAIDKGITVATHLANVMTGLHHRDIGGFGACLLRDEVTCELICDGLHVSLPMIEIILRVKNNDQIMMISDCSQMAGAPVGRYKGFFPGIKYIEVTPEGFVLSDTGRLCGSSQPVIYGMKNLVEKLNRPIEDVVKMSSLTTSVKYGFASERGSLARDKYADFVVIDNDFKVKYTYSEGRKVYDHEVDKDLFNPEFLKRFNLE